MHTEDYNISNPDNTDYAVLIDIWEASVRATHHFLQEKHIRHFKSLILNEYFDAVNLLCVRGESGEIVGFAGLSREMIEMLFVHPQHFGKGIGKKLMTYAITEYDIRKVDVNEQNPDALAFYTHLGFEVKSRSPLDGLGMPFPILHLELPDHNSP